MEEWKEYKLGEVVRLINGRAYSQHELFDDGKYRIVRVGNLSGGDRWFYSNMELSDEKYCEKGDLLYAWACNFGPYIWKGEKTIYHYHIWKLVEDEDVVDKLFLFHYLKYLTPYWLGNVNGSVMVHITKGTMEKFPITLPSLRTQRRIASILSSLDDKIEVNRRINDNLEQQAQALFKSWFVDFEPFKGGEFVESELGMIPNGWNVGKLEDILELRRDNIRKEDKWDYPYLPIDIIPMHSLGIYDFKSNDEAQSSLQLFEKNDIVIGAMRVYFHRVVIAPQKGITRNTCFVLRPKNDNSLAFSVLLCNTEDAISFASRTSKGSTMPYSVWEGGFNTYKFPCPPNNVIADFDKLCKPYLERIRDAYKENVRLASLRDTLLPRLMSGELSMDGLKGQSAVSPGRCPESKEHVSNNTAL